MPSPSVTTKSGPGLKNIRESLQTSLSKLGVSYVDLFLIHWPYDLGKDGYPTHEEAWKIMEELKVSPDAPAEPDLLAPKLTFSLSHAG
jgi:diketogulonate reductase-like aldo/keto reductase